MFIYEMWLFDLFFPKFCESDKSRYGYLEVFLRISRTEITRVDCLSFPRDGGLDWSKLFRLRVAPSPHPHHFEKGGKYVLVTEISFGDESIHL